MSNLFNDIVIDFRGGIIEEEQRRLEEWEKARLKDPNLPRPASVPHSGDIIGAFGSGLYIALGRRNLTARFYAAEFGSNGKEYSTPASVNNAYRDVRKILSTDEYLYWPGVVCIMGSSLGGRNALDLGCLLCSAGVPVAYIGLCDVSLWDRDTVGPPTAGSFDQQSHEIPGNVPVMKNVPQQDQNAVKHNFYQTLGNWIHDGHLGKSWWSSCGGEVHGEIPGPGFNNTQRDLGSTWLRNWGKDDETHHNRVVNLMIPPMYVEINNTLDQLVAFELAGVPKFPF